MAVFVEVEATDHPPDWRDSFAKVVASLPDQVTARIGNEPPPHWPTESV